MQKEILLQDMTADRAKKLVSSCLMVLIGITFTMGVLALVFISAFFR